MAINTLKGVKEINGEAIVVMDDLKESNPEMFNENGSMKYEIFERDIRPNKFIYVRNDVNSLAFTLQNGPIKENGKNGCQVTDIIAVAAHIIEKLNKKFPCEENKQTLNNLLIALEWQNMRTRERKTRGVEGFDKA